MIEPYANIREASTHIRNRALSPVALVDACLARIEALNPRLNALITVIADAARAAAQAAQLEIIVAKPSGDLDVLTIGHEYEQAAGWFMKHPS